MIFNIHTNLNTCNWRRRYFNSIFNGLSLEDDDREAIWACWATNVNKNFSLLFFSVVWCEILSLRIHWVDFSAAELWEIWYNSSSSAAARSRLFDSMNEKFKISLIFSFPLMRDIRWKVEVMMDKIKRQTSSPERTRTYQRRKKERRDKRTE